MQCIREALIDYKTVIPAQAEVLFNSVAGQPSAVALMLEVTGSPPRAFGDDGNYIKFNKGLPGNRQPLMVQRLIFQVAKVKTPGH